MNKQSKNIIYGLISAGFFISLCVLIRPQGLSANDGLSYFGGLNATVVPYALSFLGYAFFCWEAAGGIRDESKEGQVLSKSLRIMALLLGGLVVTPHNFVNKIHTALGATLFSFQLVLSFWIAIRLVRNRTNYILVAIELLSGLAAFYYLPRSEGLLMQSQVIYQLAFAMLLMKALNKKSAG